MKEIKVNLGTRSYNIFVGYNILSKLKNMLSGSNGMIITDRNVFKYWKREIQSLNLPVYSITPGESSKNLKYAEMIYKEMLKRGLSRKSFLVAFGGGVVGDLTGFIAATYMRGISYIQVPTTLMAQTDSSIGGKTGVDLLEGKNLVGSFYQPEFVFIDIKLLSTLPRKELKSGMAEVIKYGVIKDKKLFEYLEQKGINLLNIKSKLWMPVIERCAKIKADIVSKDERETKGLRAILNYGHTIGHAIEAVNKYSSITHGEAVARGMLYAGILANKFGYLSDKDMKRQNDLINLLINPQAAVSYPKIIKHLKYDKKNIQDKIRFILADRIGHAFVSDRVKESDIREAIVYD
jgi:3-dehydroquinate synthase